VADLQWAIDAYTLGFAALLQKQIRLSDVELDPGLHLQNQQLLLPRNSPAAASKAPARRRPQFSARMIPLVPGPHARIRASERQSTS
jgi:hypothetical protein